MKKRSVTLLAIVIFLVSAVSAQAVTLGEMLPELLDSHNRIKAAASKSEAAGYAVDQAEGGYYPKLDYFGESSYEEINSPGGGEFDETELWRNYHTLRATQLLWDFKATSGAVHQAEAMHKRSEKELESVRQTIIYDGAQAYLACMRAYEKLVYSIRSEERIKDQTGMEETLVEKGAGLSSDVLQAKQQLAGARALRVLVKGELNNAMHRFKAVFGNGVTIEDVKFFVRPPAPFAALPKTLDGAVAIAAANNPQLQMAGKDIQAAEQKVVQARARFFPVFNAYAEGVWKKNDDGVEGDRDEKNFGVSVNWNILNGGSDLAAFKSAKAEVRQASHSLLDLNRTVEEQVRNAWEDFITFQENAAYLQNQANILGEFLELARKERKMGTRSLLDVLNAELTYINAISNSVTAEYDTMMAAYNVLLAMGALDASLF